MITLVVAINNTRTIGLDGKMPWHNPEDLQHFKNYTMHKTLLMGRKTFEGLPKKLHGRNILVVTRQADYEGAVLDLNNFLETHQNTPEEIIVAGGGEIYQIAMDYAEKIVLSIIDNDVKGDTFFPEIDPTQFEVEETKQYETFKCITYTRKEEMV